MRHLFLGLFFLTIFSYSYAEDKITVFGAASLSNVLQEIAKDYKDSKVVFSFDASSKLAKQIESGAPADLFFAADIEWVDYLEQKNKIEKGSRIDLLSNRIVLIVPQDSKKIPSSPKDLSDSFYHHIALAGEAVPAGKFARKALEQEKAFDEGIKKKVVNADNVRVALSWVASHEASAGVVYATDVKIEPKVKIAYTFPESSHPRIIYTLALTKQSKNKKQAVKFLEFLKSSGEKFKAAGFTFIHD
jgi:molybdate transport system substrate-binding protein